MVNIRKLNELVILNAYFLLLQIKIITNIQKCINLVIFNMVFFFYQQLLYLNHQFIFLIITHRGQKIFYIFIIDYINLVAYIKPKIDNILQTIYKWVQTYINNIICKVKSLSNLFQKLYILFDIFLKYNISIKPTKSYLNYSNIGLLG